MTVFLRTFFKVIKAGIGEGSIRTCFCTGVLPVTMDDLTSGYNIAEILTLEHKEEYTKYSYELDENEKPTGIIAKTTSTGTVIDINGNAYDETKTDTRTIGITIE